jgi:hypothetical protein
MSLQQTRVFFKTAMHAVWFVGHLNCSVAWLEVGELAMCWEHVGETTSKTLRRETLQREKCGALGDQV